MAETNSTFDATDDRDSTSDGSAATRSELYREWLDVTVLAPLRIAWNDWRTKTGSLIILFYVLMGTVGLYLVPAPTQGQGPRLTGPFQSMSYPLGTDNLGTSLLSDIVYSTPPVLKMILAGAVFSTIMATIVGTVSGYKGGTVDSVLTTFTDIAMTIPGLPLIILLIAVFEPESPYVIGVFLVINSWAGLARSIRSQVLSIRDHSYVEVSRIMGASTPKIIVDDVLPNIMPYVLINFVNSARGVIFGSVALFYLGFLSGFSNNWGITLNEAFTNAAIYSLDGIYWLLFPMIAIVGLSFGLVLFAQGTEKLFNPRIRARHADAVDDTAPYEE
ncbi:binding-protein-dependent transport systems inner membrane component (plasmid) [Haloterrigena turkmenica DSM 5511]|uniref:Binding-protein-dependent transport systems inner membrane component n=1 Tax=Haloterrigena turkmenica (strain ATCC 51198 / DSM 5511 / JCM 9101 / NCIMB 13204 / VKM B-1734 / 4k) TaxID=543526 RepID=D2S1M8_HALTV|nr:ABC transporter permease [Haloterrigena turkmenica]ADB63275.1 binding-protein-dependent transport systems inner membrane component [Haloterrigena turkmenica DSM 5511]